jgi:hypothetical protein
MHQGCVRSRQRRRGGSGGWWPTSPSCRWGGRPTTPASWPPTTKRIYPATVSPQAGGTAPAPPPSGCRAKHRRPASRPCSRAATRRRGSCSAAPTAATACPPSTWSCGRPRACRSSTGWATRPPAGRSWPPTMPGWPRRSPTWTDTRAPAAATADMSTCPDTNNWRRLGFPDDDLAEEGSNRLVDSLVAWGDREAVAQRVKEHLDAGADHVCIQVFDAEPHGLPIRQWRALARAML